jgi:hypothetical protein
VRFRAWLHARRVQEEQSGAHQDAVRGVSPRARFTPYSGGKVANRSVWGFGWEIAHAAVSRRPPIFLSTMVPRTHMYTYAANVWDLSIVQGPFSVAPCQTQTLRFATFASRYAPVYTNGAGHAVHASHTMGWLTPQPCRYNRRIFGGQLPVDLEITWNARLMTTAGITKYSLKRQGSTESYTAKVELSTKVLDSYDKLASTLCHELVCTPPCLSYGCVSRVEGARVRGSEARSRAAAAAALSYAPSCALSAPAEQWVGWGRGAVSRGGVADRSHGQAAPWGHVQEVGERGDEKIPGAFGHHLPQLPDPLPVQVPMHSVRQGTRYHRVEGNRRASRPRERSPTRNPESLKVDSQPFPSLYGHDTAERTARRPTQEYNRHSKSIDLEKKCCGLCR